MPTLNDLRDRFRSLQGRSYNAYKSIAGDYEAPGFRLSIDHVQGDPFAQPSRVRALVPAAVARLPAWTIRTGARRTATADFLNRDLHSAFERESRNRGSGRSGEITVLRPGQEVLDRTSVHVGPEGAVEARFRVGLPARGRRILGNEATQLLVRAVPAAVRATLLFRALDAASLRRQVETVEDARALREQLASRGLVAFVADDAVLPRRSGVDDHPLGPEHAVNFRSTERLRVTLHAPNAGPVHGMGFPAGITLIVGGGYHGKSTLLRAIERGVYDHIPGDGRERVVTVPGAVKVRAEDGRHVAGTDISNFIGRLPGGQDTRRFQTSNASGSTSQAAAIVEALEAGATCLLLDEDTSATNFMIRDARMQALVADELEPITAFIDRSRQLFSQRGVSTILVVGGSGDYFDVADTVIAMHDYEPLDLSSEARRIAAAQPTQRRREGGAWRPIVPRVPLPHSIDPSRGRRAVDIKVRAKDRVAFGREEVDLGAVEQIVELAQARALAEALAWASGRVIDGRHTMAEALTAIMEAIAEHGLGRIHPEPIGELAEFRILELAAFVNRIRTLETK